MWATFPETGPTTARVVLSFAAVCVTCVVWVFAGCNGILGNEVRIADGGSQDPTLQGGCPAGQKFCAGIKTCGPQNDPAFGCAGSTTCEPCTAALGAMAACDGTGKCTETCTAGFAICPPTSGCTDLSNPDHCGLCNTVCGGATPFCTPVPNRPAGTFACEATCPSGTSNCNDPRRCFDITSAPDHCGDCATKCAADAHGVAKCANKQCTLACSSGYRLCATMGCQRQDVNSCGDACVPCPVATGSQCVQQPDGKYACSNTCTAPLNAVCNGSCVDTETDSDNCGRCNHFCASGICSSGACIAGTSGIMP